VTVLPNTSSARTVIGITASAVTSIPSGLAIEVVTRRLENAAGLTAIPVSVPVSPPASRAVIDCVPARPQRGREGVDARRPRW